MCDVTYFSAVKEVERGLALAAVIPCVMPPN